MVGRVESFAARGRAQYALHGYLHASRAARWQRSLSRKLRGKPDAATGLPTVNWTDVLPNSKIQLVETAQLHGNVRLSELAILVQAAAHTPPGSRIIEIGTFDGRTALNFAVNAPAGVPVLTLDLPASQPTAFAVEESERILIEKPASGERLRSCAPPWRDAAKRVTQAFGDSATFDWSPFHGQAGLVFIDGSHAYDYARKDSETAFRLVRPRGLVIWHDYGVWPGVTRALDELSALGSLDLRHIRGTSLVFWQAPGEETASIVPAGHGEAKELNVAPTEA